ncbi:MAG: hypothetical protein RTU92_14565 [Candidatus Thorarchaeota archaeon]
MCHDNYSIILLLFISSIFVTTLPADAQHQAISNQGLFWGFDEGARFDYTLRYHYETPSVVIDFTEQLYFVVENITPVPDPLLSLNPSYCYDTTAFWMNGTWISYPSSLCLLWNAYPIGNWSVFSSILQSRVESYPEYYQMIDTPFHIGYIQSIHSDTIIEYSKSDGVVNRFTVNSDTSGTILELTRLGYISDGFMFTGIICASIIGIVVVVVLVRRFRSS